ncbi:aromatic-ring-hydroxylating dioxygenase subunit alpha [Citricoccus zhacaiensis]|uniref:Aromatic-ring-hydroxylating dioxygenase subunit alpha n=1 Tax=Citricoccus zhacaiensis TaxID=489142 RepID=A0ABQ2MA41_9MICC|nr:aromatic ring-hydroxylating dioxygenase subunit alpha [Citricoccus zhacaiensis]GGO48690.1 aromatic-ring-hydroxylating dioxygenase subunit alpha [Citricoccus zhacaiensis]
MTASTYVNDDRQNHLFQVNREVFTSQEILEKEKQEIFSKAWIYVGHESEIPNKGDFQTRDVAGRPVIFNRDRHGEVRVMLNSCLHRGASLCRHSSGNAKIFTCFYHGWAYRNSGELVNVPGNEDYKAEPAKVYEGLKGPAKVESYRGLYFVNFDEDAESLEDYLGEAKYFIDLVADQSPEGIAILEGTHKYSIKANWKLLVENSVDGYHAKSVHHTYFEMMMDLGATPPMLGEEIVNGVAPSGMGTEFPNGHATLMYPANGLPLATESVKETLAGMRRTAEERFGESYATAMFGLSRNSVFFPSFIVIDLSFGLTLRTMYPISPSETIVTGWQIIPKGVDEEFIKYRVDNALTFWGPAGLATPDDVEALEQAQKAFSTQAEIGWSDISKGMGKQMPAANDELQMRAWWREWNKRMTGEALPSEGKSFVPFQKQTTDA